MLGIGAIAWGLWQMHASAGAKPRTLRLLPDGRVVLRADGLTVEARPAPDSLRLGGYVLLVLETQGNRRRWLLLGPGILAAGNLAALGRWLQRVPGGGETGPGVLR